MDDKPPATEGSPIAYAAMQGNLVEPEISGADTVQEGGASHATSAQFPILGLLAAATAGYALGYLRTLFLRGRK